MNDSKDLEKLLEISKTYNSINDFIEDEYFINVIDRYKREGFSKEQYKNIIKALLIPCNIKNCDVVEELFSDFSLLTIADFKKYLYYIGNNKWEIYREEHKDLYTDFFINLSTYLKECSLSKTLDKYDYQFHLISNISKVSYEEIVLYLTNYKLGIESNDLAVLSKASSNIKNLLRIFNNKSRQHYIDKYIDMNIKSIEPLFDRKTNDIYKKIKVEDFLCIINDDLEFKNDIKKFMLEKFEYVISDNEAMMIISNVLDQNDLKIMNSFDITECLNNDSFKMTKAFNRLSNYLSGLENNFQSTQYDLILDFMETDNINNDLKLRFNNYQLNFLYHLKLILKEANSKLTVADGKLSFVPNAAILSEHDYRRIKLDNKKYNNYCLLKNIIYKRYYMECKKTNDNDNNLDEIDFSDSNYYLTNFNYLLNISNLVSIFSNLDDYKLNGIKCNLDNFYKLKKLFIDDGVLACFLIDGSNIETLINIINNTANISKSSLEVNFSIDRLCDISKKANLFNYIDDITLALLGEDVSFKIVYNSQFLQGRDTPDRIKLRLRKAKDLMKRAEYINNSAIPYFEPICISDVFLERYNNNDPNILTSGIDSNTCFKLSANDNDYLFYSILNKNGMVAKISNKSGLIGRITAHRLSNCLLINGIRSKDNDYQVSSFEELELNDKIVNLVVKFSQEMIRLTTNSDCPIDFVVCNRAGILNSNQYDDFFPRVIEYYFKNPIDCSSDDFFEFRHLYDASEQFFQDVQYYDGTEAPFVTDFGNYPIVLLASRNNKNIDRRSDISYISPAAIYERPREQKIVGNGKLSIDIINKIRKIDAIFYLEGNSKEDFCLFNSNNNYVFYEISDNSYYLVDSDYNIISNYFSGFSEKEKGLVKK